MIHQAGANLNSAYNDYKQLVTVKSLSKLKSIFLPTWLWNFFLNYWVIFSPLAEQCNHIWSKHGARKYNSRGKKHVPELLLHEPHAASQGQELK